MEQTELWALSGVVEGTPGLGVPYRPFFLSLIQRPNKYKGRATFNGVCMVLEAGKGARATPLSPGPSL